LAAGECAVGGRPPRFIFRRALNEGLGLARGDAFIIGVDDQFETCGLALGGNRRFAIPPTNAPVGVAGSEAPALAGGFVATKRGEGRGALCLEAWNACIRACRSGARAPDLIVDGVGGFLALLSMPKGVDDAVIGFMAEVSDTARREGGRI
jgi:hypothetical protein